MHNDRPCNVSIICLFDFIPGAFVIQCQFAAAFLMIIAHRKQSQMKQAWAVTDYQRLFQRKKTRSSKLLNVNQIPQYTMKLLHKPALFNLQPEDQSRHYPGRHRPQGFKPTCNLVFQQSEKGSREVHELNIPNFTTIRTLPKFVFMTALENTLATEITYKKMHPMTQEFCFHSVICSGQFYLALKTPVFCTADSSAQIEKPATKTLPYDQAGNVL